MNQKPYRVTFFSLDDTWCRYFGILEDAMAFMNHQESFGYTVTLKVIPEL
jgi:hypothetical protein